VTGTPLRIPYGNKDVALKLGARYGSAGCRELIFLYSASADGYNDLRLLSWALWLE
jgi:hypothetical protein